MPKTKIKNFLEEHKAIFAILVFAFIVRVVFFGIMSCEYGEKGFYPDINEDAGQYLSLGKNIAKYGEFVRDIDNYDIEVFRTPGYPMFIALVLLLFNSISVIILIQFFIWFFTVWLVYKMGILIFNNKKIGIIASIFLAFDPTIIYWNNQLTSETFFTFLLVASIYYLFLFFKRQNWNYLWISAFAFSWANITRPIGQYLVFLFLALIIFYAIKNKKYKYFLAVLIFGISVYAIAFPVLVRNKIVYKSTDLSTVSGVGFGKYLSAMNNELGHEDFKEIEPEWLDKYDKRGIENEKLIFNNAKIKKELVIEKIKNYPLVFLKIHILSAGPFFLGDGYVNTFKTLIPKLFEEKKITDWQGEAKEFLSFIGGRSGANFVVFWTGKIVWGIIFLLFAVGAIQALIKKQTRWQAIFLLAIIYYFFLASGVGGYSRFRFPVNPFILFFAGMAISFLHTKIKLTKNKKNTNL